jgi:DNA-binding IclR family transcriptional regulator
LKAQSVSIVRVARALDALAESHRGASLEELAAELEMSRSAALRLFESLVGTGIAVRTESRRYRLSLKAYEWGNQALAVYAPSVIARREMSRLASQIKHRVWYAVLERGFAMTIERTEFIEGETLSFPTANRSPWWMTASGVVIAAFSASAEQINLLQGAGADPATDPSELEASLKAVRQKGLASRSYDDYGVAVAAPVLDASGYAVAAIGITMHSVDGLDIDLEHLLNESAARCSNDLGYSRMLLVT